MAKMTPEQEAAYALDYGVARSDLSSDAQLAYDRLVEQRDAARSAPAHAEPSGPLNPMPNWQVSPPYGPGPSTPPVLPDKMKAAVWLMCGGAVMSVVYSVVSGVVTHNMFTTSTYNTPAFHQITYGGEIFGVIVEVVLWAWMIWKVWTGRSWARILSTVFFGFTCLQLLLVLISAPGISKALMTAYFVVALFALIMLYVPESSAFFKNAELARNPYRAGYMPPGYGPPPHGSPPYGQPPYGAPPYGQPPYGQPPYGQPPYGQPPYGPPPYGQPGFAPPASGQPGSGQPSSWPGTFGQPSPGPAGFAQPSPGPAGFAQPSPVQPPRPAVEPGQPGGLEPPQ